MSFIFEKNLKTESDNGENLVWQGHHSLHSEYNMQYGFKVAWLDVVFLRRKIFHRSSWSRCRGWIRRSCCCVRFFWRFWGFWRFGGLWTWRATFFWPSPTSTFLWFLWFPSFRLIRFSFLGFLGFFRLWLSSPTSFSGMFHCWSYMPEKWMNMEQLPSTTYSSVSHRSMKSADCKSLSSICCKAWDLEIEPPSFSDTK